MSGRRRPQSNSKQGQPSKKLKADGPDIPSSNFAAKPKPQQVQQFSKYPARNSEAIKSIPQTNLNLQNPTAVLKKMALPEMYKEVMGPDLNELKRLAKEKARKEEELKKKRELEKPLLEKLRKEQEEERKREKEAQPKDLILDASGRLRDEKGNVINLNPTGASSLKVNINKSKQEKVKELLKLQRGTGVNRSSKLFDPMLQSRSASLRDKRKNNAFHFIEKGSIMHKGDILRGHTEGNLSQDQMVVEDGATDKSIQKLPTSDIQVGIRRIAVKVKRHDPIPDVEWWDAPLLPPDRKSYLPEEYLAREKEGIQKEKYEGRMEEETPNEGNSMNIEEDKKQSLIERYQSSLQYLESDSFTGEIYHPEKITHMVEHPASFKTDGGNQNVIIPTYLTKDERKKLRRKRRLEREKDKQEKISLGLMKPPPPKVKYSNFMNIMKDEAVLDPTKAEIEVRKAIQDRLQAHLDRNAKKKLTKEQRGEKSMRKLRRDSALECRVAVFRIEDLSNGQQRFKVKMNAEQLALNGVCIIADKKLGLNLPNVVVVEGGPKAIKFYKKLMLRRIKWNHKPQKEATGEAEVEKTPRPAFENRCTLVWEGVLKDHNFNKWKVVDIRSELEGRRVLADRGVEFYWDRALIGEATEDLDED